MLSANEWDPLKEVIVGRADFAKVPPMDISLRTVNFADRINVDDVISGYYPQQVIDEANEDLQRLADYLTGLGVVVHRPEFVHEPEYYNYCPRDTALVIKDFILQSPNPIRARANENDNLMHIFSKFNYVATQANRSDISYNMNSIGSLDILALNEIEPLFDAANAIRANDDIYYLVSNTGNMMGSEFLKRALPKKYRVHPIQGVYNYVHIDTTISFLQEGLMLLNPSRVKSLDQLPQSLQSWDVIWAPEPVDIGHYGNYNNASKWINVNLFMVNPKLAIIEEHQTNLASMLEAKGIQVELMPMRHARTLGGCFHCVTLDLIREQ